MIIEFDVDMGYLLEEGELDRVVLTDENGEHGPMTFYPIGGKLTAEQVRELIAPYLHARPTFDFGRHGAVWRADFQAIADELNATMGSGTCEDVGSAAIFKCSVCGWQSNVFTFGKGMPCYCPQCGKAVKR